jgi:hypothetical protein
MFPKVVHVSATKEQGETRWTRRPSPPDAPAAKIAKAAKVVDLAEYKAFQVAKAQELIELRAIVRTAPALYLAVSSDGSVNYEVNTAAHSCSCKAGERGLRCYHLAAADILAAA